MSRLRVSRDEASDLDDIWLYIAQRGGADVVQGYVERLTGKFDVIASIALALGGIGAN